MSSMRAMPRVRALLGAVEDGHIVTCPHEMARHRRAHDTEADEGNLAASRVRSVAHNTTAITSW